MVNVKRGESREELCLPLKLVDGTLAVTWDVSSDGMYVMMDGVRQLSGMVFFEMHMPEARVKFSAVGEVVRLDHRGSSTGVALRLSSQRLEPLD
jgi:hypothetical protein